MRPRTTALVGACLLLAALPCPAPACKSIYPPRGTFAQRIAEADIVFYATLANATPPNPPAEGAEGVTDILIGKVVKPHAALKDREKIHIDQYLPGTEGKQFLILCDEQNGKIIPYFGTPFPPNDDLRRYIEGVIKLQGAKPEKRLRYYFNFLQSREQEIAGDAFREFEIASYPDVRAVAKDLPPEKLIGWLKAPQTGAWHRGLYAVLLGHCSKDRKRDADLLRSLDGPALAGRPAVADLLIGQILLRPKAGWAHVRGILSDPEIDFTRRYAALRCLRFFVDNRPEVVPREELLDGICMLLGQDDIADLPIENLRRWKWWDMTDRVLALKESTAYKVPIVKRAVLRFAMASPDEAAKRYVAEMRQTDPDIVKDVKELLRFEQEAKQAPTPK